MTFPLFAKIVVKGPGIHPLYQFLTSSETDPKFAGEIGWNFDKFLVNRKGEVIARFKAGEKPESPALVKAVEAAGRGEVTGPGALKCPRRSSADRSAHRQRPRTGPKFGPVRGVPCHRLAIASPLQPVFFANVAGLGAKLFGLKVGRDDGLLVGVREGVTGVPLAAGEDPPAQRGGAARGVGVGAAELGPVFFG